MLLQGPDGRVAIVDDENRLTTFAVSTTEDKHLNLEGKVFSLFFSVTPAAADDYFFYLKNTSVSDLAITDIRISSSVATTIFYEIVTGTPAFVGSTSVTPVNRNLGSANTLGATIRYDTDITGLTTGGVLFFEEIAVANTLYHMRTTSNIIIPQGKAVAFRREAATGAITCNVSVVDGSS